MARRVLLSLLCALIAVNVCAERVSQDEAALVANHFMNPVSTGSAAKKAPVKRMVLKQAAVNESQYYIYENVNGEGWVMVAADDVVRPILAYSKTGRFRTDNMPKNVKGWLSNYERQINYAVANNIEANAQTQQEWMRLRKGVKATQATPVVAPLVKTGWDQDAPFWNLCPTKSSSRCYTGCVATAMAQVMYYHKWPKQGIGSHTDKAYTSCSANFGETTYDWNNMLLDYSGSSTATQKTAVATLMYHCGVACDMQYNTASAGGSGAYTIDYNGYWSSRNTMCAETALKQFFGYDASTIKGYARDGNSNPYLKKWTRSQWIAMLKEELDAARPIMYAGVGYEDPNDEETAYGHSFVCDGYDSNDYFHFNFGWSNWCDGYYDVDALNTTDPGSGGGNGEYNYQQDVIVGIQPLGHAIVKNATGCTITPSASVAKNEQALTVAITPTDATYDFTSIAVSLGSTALSQGTHYTLSADKKTLTILASAITGDASNDLTITAVWTKNRYKYEMLGENCTEELEGMLAMTGVPLELTITPDDGYSLASAVCWGVEMGEDLLEYGIGFTYDASTNKFRIAEVTGDVVIYAYGSRSVTWIALTDTFATNVAVSDKITLPTGTPAACADKVFVGWCTTANYSSATTAPTFAKTNDTYSVDTYYAVFATEGGGGGGQKSIYLDEDSVSSTYGSDTEVARCGITCYYTNVMKSSSSTIQMKKSGSYIANKTSLTKIDSIIINGVTSLTVYAGTTAKPSSTTISRSGNKYDFSAGTYSFFMIKNNNNNAVYPTDITIYYSAGGSSYSNYTTSCAPAPKYTVRFLNNSQEVSSEQYYAGQTAVKPANPSADCDDYTFVGWWTEDLAADNTESHTWVTNFTVSGAQDYYAVYSKTEVSAGSGVESVNFSDRYNSDTNIEGTKITIGTHSSVTFTKRNGGTDTQYYSNGTSVRWYGGGTCVIASDEGSITKIVFTFGSNDGGNAITANKGLYSAGTWTGEQNSVTFSQSGTSGNRRIEGISVTIGGGSTTYYTTVVNCGATKVEQVQSTSGTTKVLRDGQIFILRGDRIYTIYGQLVE